jgi:AraC-like DNA-binding protein
MPRLREFLQTPLDARQASELVTSVVHNLCVGLRQLRRIDERITRALGLIRQNDAAKIPIEEVARKVFLSRSRLAHLFTEEVGVPFRRYVLWRKLSRALQAIGRGRQSPAVRRERGRGARIAIPNLGENFSFSRIVMPAQVGIQRRSNRKDTGLPPSRE